MKISVNNLTELKRLIELYFEENGGKEKIIENYESGNFKNANKVQDLQTRFMWDLLWASGGIDFIDKLYEAGLNDNHITTALKNICPKVIKKY